MTKRIIFSLIALLLIAAAGLGPALIKATSIELGSAGTTDTTITRSAAGVAAVEGNDVAELATAQTWTATQTMRQINPSANATYPLGSTAAQWTNLFLSEGATINWDNGDCVLTQTGNSVDLTGCTAGTGFGSGSQTPWTQNIDADTFDLTDADNISGATSNNLALGFEGFIGVQVAEDFGGMSLVNAEDGSHGTFLYMLANSASPADNDQLGDFAFQGKDDGGNSLTYTNLITTALDVSDTTEDSKFVISVMANGSEKQAVRFGSGSAASSVAYTLFGPEATDPLAAVFGGFATAVQMVSTSATPYSLFGMAQFNATGGNSSNIYFAHSKGATVGDYTVAASGDALGGLVFFGSDGTDFAAAASIQGLVDGTPGNNDMPGALAFRTSPDGTASTVDRLSIRQDGGVIIGNGSTSPGAEDLSLEGGDMEFGNAGTAGTDTTLSYAAAGELNIEGDRIKHAGIQTIPLLAGAATLPSAGGIAACTNVNAFDSGSNDVFMRQCSFSAATDNAAYWTVPFPKSAAEGTFTVVVDWTSATTTDGSDNVIWTAAAVCFSNDDPINGNAFPSVVNITDTQTASGDFLRSPDSGTITPAGSWAEGDTCVLRITRDADNASDNFNGSAELLNVQLYYTDNASSDD